MSQLATQSQFAMDELMRPAKRQRLGFKKAKYNKFKKRTEYLPIGKFRILRWSNKDTSQNTHVWIQGNDTLPAGDLATTFALSDVAGAGELVSLFDNFRITKVLYRWVITRTPDYASTTANRGWFTRVNWTHDFNDSTPITRALMYQRSDLKEEYLNADHPASKWYSLNPAALVQLYESTTATSYGPRWRQWMDTSDQAAPHYGIKFTYDNLYTGLNLRLEAKLMIECKGIS